MSSFSEQVYAVVKQVPYGKVVSYSQISWMLGYIHRARHVGHAMRECPPNLPAHRVVRADGSVSGGDADMRKVFLEDEGVTFLPSGRVDMKTCCWDGKSE